MALIIFMSRLIIAEKPSLARAIADALPKPHKKEAGCIRCANGDVVTWCIGHLLEQCEPDDYEERYKKWRLDDLPISPQEWKLKVRSSAKVQFNVVKGLLKQSFDIVHAGDPDREGQLLVDEVLSHCKVSAARIRGVQRLLINDLNLSAVKRSLNDLRSNHDFVPLSVSALARSRADWLFGMNMSRAYTLLGQKAGYRGVLSVGRVQTPVLGLVVRRDDEIANFVPKNYFTLHALIPYQDGNAKSYDIRARWKPSEACQPYQDEEGRVLNKALVENVARRIAGQPASVTHSEQKETKEAPPLPYSLSALQIDAARRFNLSAQQVLDICQALYEKHKLITYPRSDCRYLPKAHHDEASAVSAAIVSVCKGLSQAVASANLHIKSKAWNDSRVEAHHAIIPTPKKLTSPVLSAHELNVYELIATQYLMQFYPAARYAESKLVFDIGGGTFVTSGRQLIEAGWKSLKKNTEQVKAQDEAPSVPPLEKGTVFTCREGEIGEKKTEPPRHFTEATLLQAMTGIARYVEDKSLKKILRDTDGIGTEATRAGIIDTLVKRQLILRQGKNILSTDAGKGLIHALPTPATLPDMTAHWEYQLQRISEKQQTYDSFMQSLAAQVNSMIEGVKYGPVPSTLQNLPSSIPNSPKKRFKRKKSPVKSSRKGNSRS